MERFHDKIARVVGKQRPKKVLGNDQRAKGKKQEEQHYDSDFFVSFFKDLFGEKNVNEDIDKIVEETLSNIQDKEPDFTIEELKAAIKSLKNNKSAGIDRIPAEFFKALPDKLLIIILKIMNRIKMNHVYTQTNGPEV